jgi:oligopeptide transport system substrate-binding protein
MAKVRRLALVCALVAVAGCGGSSTPTPPRGGPVLRLTLLHLPSTLDPARVSDLPSVNVAHELYAGLTRFSGTGVEPDLAESWEPSEGGLVWTFHLREGIRWSDGRPITAEDFRRSWLRALAPGTHSAYARAEMQNIRGARRYRATGSGEIDVAAVSSRTLRVTLQHPVPWFDQQVAWPVFFPVPSSGRATSGPFRPVSRGTALRLERNNRYWNVGAVKPRRIVLTTSFKHSDGFLPLSAAPPGFPWVQDGLNSSIARRRMPRLAVELLWLVNRGPLADERLRQFVSSAIDQKELVERYVSHRSDGGERPLSTVVPPAMPGADEIGPASSPAGTRRPLELTLAYSGLYGEVTAFGLRAQLARVGIEVELRPAVNLSQLTALAGPPVRPGVDMVLLGWSSEFFDPYNILDLFPCASAFNVAQWCDRSYDRLMRRAVRTLDDGERYRLERTLVRKLATAVPAVPLYAPFDNVYFERGVGGFRWSPIGVYELEGMTRS